MCFKDADHVIVAPLYTAGENPIAGIDHRSLADRIRARGGRPVEAVDDPGALVPALRRLARPGDIVVCLGAGNSTEWAHALPDWLAEEPKRTGSVG
jgi:UDP-N-acetylmuramate--alanine ligase